MSSLWVLYIFTQHEVWTKSDLWMWVLCYIFISAYSNNSLVEVGVSGTVAMVLVLLLVEKEHSWDCLVRVCFVVLSAEEEHPWNGPAMAYFVILVVYHALHYNHQHNHTFHHHHHHHNHHHHHHYLHHKCAGLCHTAVSIKINEIVIIIYQALMKPWF